MKPTAILLTVMLLMAVSLLIGSAGNKKKEVVVSCDLVFETPAMEENVDLPPPPPDSIKDLLPTIAESEPVGTAFGIEAPPVITIGCDLIPRPVILEKDVKEKDDSDNSDDSAGVSLSKVEIEAEYPGGAAAWQRFLNKNLRYPQEDIDNEESGSVLVQFVVDEKGNVSDVEVLKGSKAFGAEAVRVIKKSGKWIPAVQGGRQVRSLKIQPIIVHLETEG